MQSLRLRLLAWLLPPLVVVAIVAAGGAYLFLERRLTAAYDHDLGDIARALLPYIRDQDGTLGLDFTPQAEAVLRADSIDQIYYALLDSQGKAVAGDRLLPQPDPAPAPKPRFWDDMRQGARVRAVVLDAQAAGRDVRVIAAETMRKRTSASRDAMLSAIVPAVLLLVAAVTGIVLGVGRGLHPLEAMRAALHSRSPGDLRPLEEQRVDDELRPLVNALNGMLSRLEDAQKRQSRFIANAAHQLRTPIAGVITQLDLARSAEAGREVHIAQAREGAARLARLAQQILSLAAADPLSNPGAPTDRCDLAEIVTSHADEWLRMAGAMDVELGFDLAPTPISGNALLVGELATNLVHNAARYGARTVTVATRRQGEHSILEVSDDGAGIPREARERVFERFSRLDSQSTEGSGLGLAIVSEIAQRHGAAIELADGPGGRGTRVAISFP
ncbi:MAG TPA: sensor histidine kinase N-terminal domain-containing protein [Usitatibacter sp.]|nr:sensor histidine kinase N-terminal domain-containing protein [Usitatibacter sp.]